MADEHVAAVMVGEGFTTLLAGHRISLPQPRGGTSPHAVPATLQRLHEGLRREAPREGCRRFRDEA